jgi:hypothetical protein
VRDTTRDSSLQGPLTGASRRGGLLFYRCSSKPAAEARPGRPSRRGRGGARSEPRRRPTAPPRCLARALPALGPGRRLGRVQKRRPTRPPPAPLLALRGSERSAPLSRSDQFTYLAHDPEPSGTPRTLAHASPVSADRFAVVNEHLMSSVIWAAMFFETCSDDDCDPARTFWPYQLLRASALVVARKAVIRDVIPGRT